MSTGEKVERKERQLGNELALRFGGSLAGVGIAAGALHLLDPDRVFTASMAGSTLLIGIILLTMGYRSRRKNRRRQGKS